MALIGPTGNTVYQDPALTSIAETYKPDEGMMVHHMAAPLVPAPKPTGSYYSWSIADLLRVDSEQVADGAESPLVDLPNTKVPYDIEDPWGNKMFTPWNTEMEADFDVLMQRTMALTGKMYLRRELEYARVANVDGAWAGDDTPNPLWDAANSNPIEDVEDAKVAVQSSTGYIPNCIVTSYAVAAALRNHEDIRRRLDYKDNQGVATSYDDLAAIFGVSKFLVSGAARNTAARGLTASVQSVMGKHMIVAYVNPTPAFYMPTSIACLYDAKYGAPSGTPRITRWNTEDPEGTMVRAQSRFKYVIIASALGRRLKAVIS